MAGPRAADLDLRVVRYFVVVAGHGNFRRAAEELFLTQPTLSRSIQHLEHQLGVRLLARTPQGAHLTAAGRAFLDEATELLESASTAVARSRAAADPHRITVGHHTNLVITPATRAFRERHPGAELHTRHLDWDEPRAALLGHRVDVAVARLPFATDQLEVAVLYEEPRVLIVAADHPLADRSSVRLRDFADEPLTRFPDERWNSFWRIDPRPDGRAAPDGPVVEGIDDNNERVAGGEAVSLAPGGTRTTPRRPDLVQLPVEDVDPSTVVVVSRRDERREPVAAFRRIAHERLGPGGRS